MSKFRRVKIIALLLLACAASFGQAQQSRQSSSTSAEQALKKLNDELYEATSRRDLPTLERIMAETLTATDDEGRISTRAQVFERIKALPDELEQAFAPDEVQVRIYGDAAVVTARVTEATEIAKQRREQQYRVTQTFVRERGANRWRLVATQQARLSGDPEAIIVNPKVYDAYVGEYHNGHASG